MYDIEPYYAWRDYYVAEEDELSPFFGREYDEFHFQNKIYNYFIHPQWDEFGSLTLYTKILFADYDNGFAILEMIGEWNDTLYNDIKFLKEEVLDILIKNGINKLIFICENVLNFHGSDDCYYEAIYEDISEELGWMVFVNTLPHVEDEMLATQLQYYVNFGGNLSEVNWRKFKPMQIMEVLELYLKSHKNRIKY